MKRIVTIITSLLLVLSLVSCGKPATVSDEMYEMGKTVLKTIDDYMDHKVDYDTTQRKISSNKSEISRIVDKGEKDEYGMSIYKDDFSISIVTISLSTALIAENYGNGSYDNLLKKRNELAKLLGESQRSK